MTTTELLQENHEKLLAQYALNLQGVFALQNTLINDILPSVADELSLSPEATEWAKEWLEDTVTIFRISRRNNFTRSFALESIRKNLVWRMNSLWPSDRLLPISMLHCLPSSAHDPFGRPVLVIQVSLDVIVDDVKPMVVHTFERLRAYLQSLNKAESVLNSPILQYIVLLDLKGLTFANLNKELITWTLREVIPRFPGMLAGVFMLNFSWIHSGMWNIVKYVLPSSAISRVFFTSDKELLRYFTPQSLPKDYGGSLPCLANLDNPLRAPKFPSSQNARLRPNGIRASEPPLPRHFPALISLSPTSLLNPFFGYPASSLDGSLSLQHGRRRKRDLVRTLALLFWMRWRKRILTGLVVTLCALGLAMGKRVGRPGFLRSFLAKQPFSSLNFGSKYI